MKNKTGYSYNTLRKIAHGPYKPSWVFDRPTLGIITFLALSIYLGHAIWLVCK